MVYLGIIGNQGDNMLLNIKGSNKATRTLVDRAAWWYAERLMGKRLMNALEININLNRNLSSKFDTEGTCIWEDEGRRPKEFTIEIDASMSIRNILITLAHEMVHVKQWAKDEMYEYYNTPKMVRFKGEKMHMDKIDYWDYPWEIEAFGRQLGLFVRFCEDVGIADRKDMKEAA
jgi:hypothetical protein|tara:strand:- start:499 stop:1020 length:522 start_codon:yes stop_codon:yes gene_type:complete